MHIFKRSTSRVFATQEALSIAAFACLLLANGAPVSAKQAASDDVLTRQAIELYEQKQTQQAIDLEKQAVKEKRGEWLPHAVLSHFLWNENKSTEAIAEGKIAVRLAPRMPALLINLAIMHEHSGDQRAAIRCFTKARQLAPGDWRAWIGEAYSLIFAGRDAEGLSFLHRMASQPSTDFNWYYQLGQTYLFVNKPGFAANTASKAVALATTTEQKTKGLFQLFLAYIRDNQIERATDLKHQVFSDHKPTDPQIYLRAASSLVPVLNPESADEIFNAAVLAKLNDSEAFFELARIFDEKASYVVYDRTKYSAWLKLEEAAYRQAIKLNSSPAMYHVGLASILAQQGKAEEMSQELAKARETDLQDQLTGYLLSKMKPLQVATADLHGDVLKAPTSPEIRLTAAQIAIKGLSCGCKRSIVANSFKQIRGLVLTTIGPIAPFKATVLIDQSMIPIADALVEMTKRKPFPELSYELISSRPIESAGEALKIDLQGRSRNSGLFSNDYPLLQPTLPVNSAGDPI